MADLLVSVRFRESCCGLWRIGKTEVRHWTIANDGQNHHQIITKRRVSERDGSLKALCGIG